LCTAPCLRERCDTEQHWQKWVQNTNSHDLPLRKLSGGAELMHFGIRPFSHFSKQSSQAPRPLNYISAAMAGGGSMIARRTAVRIRTSYPIADGNLGRCVDNPSVACAKPGEEATISISPARSVVPIRARQRPLNALCCGRL